jgi:hypothetical protein
MSASLDMWTSLSVVCSGPREGIVASEADCVGLSTCV